MRLFRPLFRASSVILWAFAVMELTWYWGGPNARQWVTWELVVVAVAVPAWLIWAFVELLRGMRFLRAQDESWQKNTQSRRR